MRKDHCLAVQRWADLGDVIVEYREAFGEPIQCRWGEAVEEIVPPDSLSLFMRAVLGPSFENKFIRTRRRRRLFFYDKKIAILFPET